MLNRDAVSGGILSYTDDSGIQNEGVLDVAVLDGRFLRRDFSRIIDTNFKSLKEATSAEANINKKIRSIQNRALIPGEFAKIIGQEPSTTLSDSEKAELAKKEFLTNISNLIPMAIPLLACNIK